MKRWPTQPLGDLVSFLGGGTPRRDRADYWGGDIPWASVKDLQGQSLETTIETITAEGLANSASNLIPKGTVIIASRVGLGKVAINRKPVAINQDLKALVPRGSELRPRYLLFFLLLNAESFERAGVGATVKGLTIADYQKLKIPVPPLAEQDRIVKLLDEAVELRKLRAEADHRNTLLPALFSEMFGDPLSNPKSYQVRQLAEVCTRITDGTHQPPPFVNTGIPFLFVRNIVRGSIDFDTEKFITPETFAELTRRAKPKRGDILYSTVGSYGVAVLVETDRQFAFQRHIGHLEPNGKVIDSTFLTAQLNTPCLRLQADQRARGVAQKTVNLAEIRQFKVLVPPLDLQEEFAQRVVEIRELEAAQIASRERLDDLFQSLLHHAFNGGL